MIFSLLFWEEGKQYRYLTINGPHWRNGVSQEKSRFYIEDLSEKVYAEGDIATFILLQGWEIDGQEISEPTWKKIQQWVINKANNKEIDLD